MNDQQRTSQQAFAFLRTVWKRKLLVAWVTILGIVAALGLSARSDKEYSATAQLLFRDPGFQQALGNGTGLFQAGNDPQRTAQTNITVLTSSSVAAEARSILGTRSTLDDLRSAISVQPSSNSDVVDITATTLEPVEAARVANAFAEGYIRYRRSTDRKQVQEAEQQVRRALETATPGTTRGLRENLRQLQQLEVTTTGKAEVVGRAQVNASPVAPKPKRDAILGGAVALLIGCGLALLLDMLDKRLRTVEDFERAYPRFPMLATVPAGAVTDPFRAHHHGPTAEAYRMLREGLRFVDSTGSAQCFLIVSAVESEGKSTVAVNLATSLAAVGQQVILIEADMRRPTAAQALKIAPNAAGLSNLLVSDDDLPDYLIDVHADQDLRVLASGTIPPNPSDLLSGRRMPEILAAARRLADIVIIDAPPLLPVSDSRVLLQLDQIDGVVVVGRMGITRRDNAAATDRVLEQSGRRVFGLALTGASAPAASSYYDAAPPENPRGDGAARSAKFRS